MNRLRIFIILFCLALSVPTVYLLLHTYRSLDQEETSELRYFANSLFDRMEEEMSRLIRQEEARAVDDYTYRPTDERQQAIGSPQPPPLSRLPTQPFILGYFQNNPDGGFQTPLVENLSRIPPQKKSVVEGLREVNRLFNRKRADETEGKTFRLAPMPLAAGKEEAADIADKYFAPKDRKQKKIYLGQQAKRTERIPMAQALNVAPSEKRDMVTAPAPSVRLEADAEAELSSGAMAGMKAAESKKPEAAHSRSASPWAESLSSVLGASEERGAVHVSHQATFKVEVDPMQSVLIDADRILVFRRIVLNNQIYRQGFVLMVRPFLRHLLDTYFVGQPMAKFTNVELKLTGVDVPKAELQAGAAADSPHFRIHRTFPRPFSFLAATLACDTVPPTAARRTLTIMIGITALIFVLGLFAIYRSARAVADLSERRAGFVSSVTHELKTPLTNIRMYIEMLEQGIARTPEREGEYFRILLSESERLTRLISNVLEFSKLENKNRRAELKEGTLADVIGEVREVMQEKLRQEGFTLEVVKGDIPPFAYDREMMIQILINLMENSLKFSADAIVRQLTLTVRPSEKWVNISLSDTGPGIPPHALGKIFDDFYRVDNDLTRNTRGTGIGLALVRKFAVAMGGTVSAANNDGGGCTITVSLPKKEHG